MRGISFEGYSHRTSSRFGSRLVASVEDGVTAVTGSQIGPALCRLWIAAQIVLF
jgi:hypothetical protein